MAAAVVVDNYPLVCCDSGMASASDIKENIGVGIILVLGFCGLAVVGDAMRAHPVYFIAVWAACPAIALLTSNENFTPASRKKYLTQLFTVCVVLSVLLAMFHGELRDQICRQFVKGFRVSYGETELDDYGRPYASQYIGGDFHGWKWLVSVATFLWWGLCIALPWIIWRMRERVVVPQEDHVQPMPGY